MRKAILSILLIFLSVSLPALADDDVVPQKKKVAFTWGGDIGGSIDMSGNDMSSLTINAMLGLKYDYIEFAGAGAGADVSLANSCRSYPFFAVVRSSFSRSPQLLFMEARGGCSVNYLYDDKRQTGAYVSVGPGIHLARGQKYASYLSMSYTYIGRRDVHMLDLVEPYKSLHFVSLRIGVIF